VGPVITIATILPTTGPDAALGQAMQNAVDLAVQQRAARMNGVQLTVTHLDEMQGQLDRAVAALAANQRVMGIVGPFSSDAAVAALPIIEQSGLATISPGATLPGLTQSGPAQLEGLQFAQLHPAGKPIAFFRLPATDDAIGKAAADVAVAPAQAHGLGAGTVFVVDDESPSGKAQVAAFGVELAAGGGTLAGSRSIVTGSADNAQAVVTAIIEAAPDLVFYAGGTAPGAELRRTLSLTGAPQLAILTASPIADHPGWGSDVGVLPASAHTMALLPARDLAALPGARGFVSAYRAAYAGSGPHPLSALAYDAALDEIGAIQSLLSAGKNVTRAAVLGAVTSASYAGVTGNLAFDKNGDNANPASFSLYTCDLHGTWRYRGSWPG
jgi:branched-chain amino acid transport system substrate-binding protein